MFCECVSVKVVVGWSVWGMERVGAWWVIRLVWGREADFSTVLLTVRL